MSAPAEAPVALVTGGVRGIGLAIAECFLAQGYRAALRDIDAATLARTEQSLQAANRLAAELCDVADPAQVEASVDAVVQRFGRIDARVNNAGIAVFKPILDTRFEEWRQVIDVNLHGALLCSRACVPP